MTVAGVTVLVLLSWQPTQRIEYRLYLSDNGESQAVRRAFEISSDEPARSMEPEQWLRIAEGHEAIREEIAELADVTIHEAPERLADYAPLYALSRYEEPRPFGRITSPFTGKEIRAWHSTWGILKHIRYITKMAHRRLTAERPDHFAEYRYFGIGSEWGDGYGLSMMTRGADPELKVFPPPRFCIIASVSVSMPWMQVKITMPHSTETATERSKRLLRYMDMNTGLLVGAAE